MDREKITDIVCRILLRHEEARCSDRELCRLFYEEWFDVPSFGLSIDRLFEPDRDGNYPPTVDTITRIRRKLTEEYSYLRGSKTVEDARYEKQTEWIDFAREGI